MFDNLKNLAGLAGMMKDLPRMKARFEEVKKQLESKTVSAESGGGAVRVTATGSLRVVSIEVEAALLNGLVNLEQDEDRKLASDLITAAVNAALAKARELAERELGAAASELGIPLPAGGLGGMLGST
jgi:DNA-binding YbaB/EbfC family protein